MTFTARFTATLDRVNYILCENFPQVKQQVENYQEISVI